MFSWPNPHSQDPVRCHLINQLLWNVRACLFALLCDGIDFFIDEHAESGLKSPVRGIIVGGFEYGSEPCGLAVGRLGEGTGSWDEHLGGFVGDSANAEGGVFLQNFLPGFLVSYIFSLFPSPRNVCLPMQIVESFCGISTCFLSQHKLSTWMSVHKLRQVIHFRIDDDPQRLLRVMLRNFFASDLLCHFVGFCPAPSIQSGWILVPKQSLC